MPPALSSTLARLLVCQSPLHAWTQCRELNPSYRETFSDEFDLGTAAHRLLLEPDTVEASHVIVDAPDWRTKAAQLARQVARETGKTPILARHAVELAEMVAMVRAQLQRFADAPIPLVGGDPEHTLEWTEAGVLCRTRCDFLHANRLMVDDVKTTGNAHPDAFGRALWGMGYDMQAAFYCRGVAAMYRTRPQFRFIVIETKRPYAVSVVSLEPDALALAERRVDRALALWRECLELNHWPGYPMRTAWVSAPPWEVAREEARAYMDAEPPDDLDDGRPLADQLWGDR
jgi:hypothetical protein